MTRHYALGSCCLCGQQGQVTNLIPKIDAYEACDSCLWAHEECLELILFSNLSREETEYQCLLRFVHAWSGLATPPPIMIALDEVFIAARRIARSICNCFWDFRQDPPDKKTEALAAPPL